jgi:D-alanyl-D-alanine carboxypeptidase
MRAIRFLAEARQLTRQAEAVARELDSRTVEAEHLLLAAARETATPTQVALEEAGLSYDEIRHLVETELAESLAVVGVVLIDFDLVATPSLLAPRWGASAKLALERALQIADSRRDRRIARSHVVLGVLRAPTGTLPRAFRRAGVDLADLRVRIEATL